MFKFISTNKTVLNGMVLFISLQIYSQYGNVTYTNEASLSFYFKTMKENDPSKFQKFEQMSEYEKEMMGQIDYILKFTYEKSIFKPSIQGDENKQLLKTKQTEGIFYNGPQSNYFYTNRRFKDYNVQLDPIKWELTSESKEILGYTCHRALGAKVYNDSITSDQTIEAWYTRDINVTHGPKGINGLPGLILEAHQGGYHFYAEEIDLDSKQVISKPKKGEEINEAEYYKLMRSAVKN